MRGQDLRPIGLFDGLTDSQLDQLAGAGEEIRIEPGVELFHEGDHADFWFLLVDGVIELRRRVGRDDTEVGKMDVPGLWSGGFRAWNEQGVYLATGLGRKSGRVLRVHAATLRELLNSWFPFGVHLVAGLHGTAHSIESNARQREFLITLGTLAAGLAHELNDPASAAVRAADALEEMCRDLLTSLGRLAATGITAAQFSDLDALRRELEQPKGPADPLALADLEDSLNSWLTEHRVDKAWVVAPPLAAAGADVVWCERAAHALAGAALEPGLEWLSSTLAIRLLLEEVKESTRRMSELVGAIKSHSQMDRAERQTVDVTDGLESTLLIMGHKLREGVTVVREYAPDTPQIDAFPGELNQVWTILIDNAVDAMGGAGTLGLSTRVAGDSVVIEVADTGPGMPAEVEARAFEPFFTTKDVGKGTGLGLDIARRIVTERHHGEIAIESRPGQTILRVRLPISTAGG